MHWRAAGSSVILLCIFTTVCLGQGRGSRRFGGPTVENAAADEQLPSASTSHRFRSSSAERRSSNLRTSQNIVERDVEDIPPSGFAKLSYPDVSRTRESRRESARDKTEGPPTVASKREFQSRSARPIESSGAKEYERLTSSTGVRGGRNGLVGRTRTSVDSTPTTPTAVTSYVRRPSLRSRVEPQKEAKESDATESIRPRNGASPLRARGGVTQEAKTTESRGRTRESSTESLRPRNGGRTVEAATAAAPTPSSRTGRQRTYQEVPGRSQFRSRGNQEPTEQPSQPSRGSSSRGTNRFPTRISNVDSSAVQSEIPTRSSNFRSKAKLASRNEVLARNTVNPTKNEEAVKTEATTSLPPSIQTVTGGNVASPVPTEPAALSSPDETSPEQQIIDNPKPDNVNVEPLTPAPELNEAKPRYEATPPSIVSRGPGGSRRRGTARGPKLEEKKSSKTEDTVSEDDNYPEVYKQLKKSGSGPKEILALLKAKKQLRESQQLSKNRPFPVTPTPLVSSRRPEVDESPSLRPAPKYSGGRNYRKSLATERVVPSSTEETPKPLEAKPERSIGRGRSNYRNLQSGTVEVGERSRPGGETRFTSAKYQSLGLGRNNRESSRRFPSRSRNQPEDNRENEVLVTPSREVSEAPTVAKDENESNELVKSRPSLEDRLQLTAPDVKKSSKYVPRNREKESEKFRARTTESVDLTASESTPIRPRYELYNRHRETGSYKRTNFVTPLATEEAPTSEKSSVADRFKSRPSFKPQRKYTGKSYTYSSRYNSRQQEHELLLTENTSTQNNNFDEYQERNTRRFNGLTVDSLVSESEQIPISTEPNSPGKKKPRYKESYIQRVPPKGKKGRATTNKPFIFPTTDLWEALSQTKDASSTESTIAALLRSTTPEAQSTEDDFLKGDLNTNNASAGFVVYGLLPNNNLVRKVMRTTKAPALDLPFIIYGLYPNGTIVRRFPNGTILPEEEEEENEIIANIDPGNREVLEEVVKKDNPLAYLYPPGFQSSTVPMTTTTTTTPSTTSTTSTTTTTERIVNITTKKPVQPSVSTTATTRKPSTTPKTTTTKPRTTQTTPRKTTTTKSKKTAATTTTRKPATTTTTTQKPTTTSKPTTTTTTTRKPTTTTTTTKMPTTTTKKPTTTTKKPTTTTTTTRKPSTTTTKKLTTSTTTTRKPTTSTTATPSTTTTTPSTTTTSTLRPEAKPTKAKSTTRSINDITTPRSQPQTTQKPRDTKSNTTPKPKPQSTLSDIELLNSVINGENSVNVTPTLSSSEGEAELANKVIQLAIERATQKSKTAPTTSKPKGKPKRKPKSTTKMTTTSTTTTTTTSTTSTTTSTTQQSTPNTTLDSLTTVTPTPTMTIFKFSEENKTVATEDNGANNKTGKISLWVLPADDNSTLTSVNGIPDKGTNQEQALQALLEQPELANLSVNEQLLLADVLSSTAFPQTTQKKRKKKPKTTPTTTTTTQAPLFPVLNALFGRNRGGGLFGGGGLFRNQIGAGRGLFGAGQDPGTSTVRTAAFGDDFDEPEPPLVQETPESQQGLVGAAINVTRAVSQFMGYVIQGATQSFQNYLQSRTRALADALTYPGSS